MDNIGKVVVIGCAGVGGPAAMMAKTLAPEVEVTVIREEENFVTRCATPYIANGDVTVNSSVKDDEILLSKGIRLVDHKATGIDRTSKQVSTADGNTCSYDELILATGASAVIPPTEGAEGCRTEHRRGQEPHSPDRLRVMDQPVRCCLGVLLMGTRHIEEEIKALERRIAYKKAATPAHDHAGAYELEEALAEKREALVEMIQQEKGRQNDISRT